MPPRILCRKRCLEKKIRSHGFGAGAAEAGPFLPAPQLESEPQGHFTQSWSGSGRRSRHVPLEPESECPKPRCLGRNLILMARYWRHRSIAYYRVQKPANVSTHSRRVQQARNIIQDSNQIIRLFPANGHTRISDRKAKFSPMVPVSVAISGAVDLNIPIPQHMLFSYPRHSCSYHVSPHEVTEHASY